MASHPRILGPFLKTTLGNFLLFCFLVLPVISCALQKQTVIPAGRSSADGKTLTFGVGQDDMIRAIAHMELITPERSLPVKAALTIKRPFYLRLEIIPLIGVPDLLLTVSPQRMKILIPSRKEFYSGRPTANNLKKFLPWSMDIEDMVMILTGTYPALKENDIEYQVAHEDNLLRMDMNAPSGLSQTIWVGEDNNQLLKLVRKDEMGVEIYHVQYTYDKNGGRFPEKIKIIMDDTAFSLSVKYSDVEMEQTTDVSIFDLVIPEGVNEMSLD
jgi:hypothetical protein